MNNAYLLSLDYCRLNSLKKSWAAQRNGNIQRTEYAVNGKLASQAPAPETPLPQPGRHQQKPHRGQERIPAPANTSKDQQVYDNEDIDNSPLKEGGGIPDNECDSEEHAAAKSSPVKAGKRVTSNVSHIRNLKSHCLG